MKRLTLSICFASALLFASNANATFISTPDDFLLDADFTLTVPFFTTITTDTIEFQESGDGWSIFVGVQLSTVNDIFNRLTFFGEKSHEVGGVTANVFNSLSPIIDGVAGDTKNIWSLSGNTELIIPHAGGDDIYEFILGITSVDRSVIGQLSMDANLRLSGRHVDQPVVGVPEAPTLALYVIGLVGLGFFGWRRTA